MISFEKYIFVQGLSESQFIEAVQELADMYSDTNFVDPIHTFKSTSQNNQFLVNFKSNPDFERFKYFVNYLNNPDVSNRQTYNPKVFGFWTISENDKLPEDKFGKRVLLYVSPNDTEGDNVNAVFHGEDKTYKLGFAIGHEFIDLNQFEFNFAEPEFITSDFIALKSISPDENIKKSTGCLVVFSLLILIVIGLETVLT